MSNRSTGLFHREQESFMQGNFSKADATRLIGTAIRNVVTGKIVVMVEKVQVAPAQFILIGNDGNTYKYIGKKIIPS